VSDASTWASQANAPTSADVTATYRERREARAARVAEYDRRHAHLAWWRFAIAAAAVGVLIWLGRPGIPWLLLAAAAFVAVAIRHAFVETARDRATRAVAFYERGLRRLDGTWQGTGETGERFRSEHHPYADDLDLFGRGSLFELLSSPRTASGENTLASWLLGPASAEVARDRQQAIDELRPRLDLRESLFVFGPDVRAIVDTDALRAWAEAPVRLAAAWPAALLPALAVVTTAHVAWWIWSGEPPRWLGSLLVVQSAVGWWFRARVHDVAEHVERRAQELGVLRDLLQLIEREPAVSPLLQRLASELRATGQLPSAEIAHLVKLADLLNTRQNQFFVPFAAMLLLGTQTAMAIDRWRARCGRLVGRWLDIAGEYETLSALAGYAAEHPADPFAEIAGDGPVLEAVALSHPLIPAERAVANDVRLGGDAPHVWLVSGSNMSGKSTWLRTIGINVVLAQAGAPVRAKRLRLSPLQVGATLRIQDSLQEGRSRFYAEITRIRELTDVARGPRPLLFLFDELFHGTNSNDRLVGASGVLRSFLERGAVGLVTTHDLALTAIADSVGAHAANVHFEEWFDAGEMRFDYRLKPGRVTRSNALALMRAVGLEVDSDG
jgi:MutS-like protein